MHLFLPVGTSEVGGIEIGRNLAITPRDARQWFRGGVVLLKDREPFVPALPADELEQYRNSVRWLLAQVRALVKATIREDRDGMADAVDAINAALDGLDEGETA